MSFSESTFIHGLTLNSSEGDQEKCGSICAFSSRSLFLAFVTFSVKIPIAAFETYILLVLMDIKGSQSVVLAPSVCTRYRRSV